jgi:Protein of unknown function (DUF3431)
MKKHLIISYYREDTSWFNDIKCFDELFLYNKNPDSDTGIKLPNVGREAHTYAYHIFNNYDNLGDINVFLQGNPFDHFYKNVNSIELNDFFKNKTYNLDIAEPVLQTMMEDPTGYSKKAFVDCMISEPPEKIFFTPGAQWIVPKKCIHSKSRSFYEKICNELKTHRVDNWDGIYNAWNLEGIWNYIFDCNIKEK